MGGGLYTGFTPPPQGSVFTVDDEIDHLQQRPLFRAVGEEAEGVAGAAHEVALRIAEGQTLFQLIRAWAPPSENNTSAYVQNVAEWAAIPDINVALWDYLGA